MGLGAPGTIQGPHGAATASMAEASVCAFLSTGRTLVSMNFATFTVSLGATARACSTLVINALMFWLSPPFTAGVRFYRKCGWGILKSGLKNLNTAKPPCVNDVNDRMVR